MCVIVRLLASYHGKLYIAGDDDDGDDNENANKRLSKESEGRILNNKTRKYIGLI